MATYQGTADYLQDHNAHYRGETFMTFTDIATRDNFVGIDLCLDGSALRFVENGEAGPVSGPARLPVRAVVTRADTGWTVTEAGSRDGSC